MADRSVIDARGGGEVSDRPTHAWCPGCKEESAIDAIARCLWCGGETRRRRAGGKPKGVHGKLRDRHLRALHHFHVEEGISIRELGRRIWETSGFASEKSAAMAISDGFKRLGLVALSQPVATAKANARRRAPGSPGTADRSAHKRWARKRAGGYRRCKATKRQYPEKGRPCSRYALVGSDYCYAHDPDRSEEIERNLAEMRSRIPGRAEAVAA